MTLIYVCSAYAVPQQIELVKPSHLVSIGVSIDTPAILERANHLTLEFADIVELTPGNAMFAPTTQHIKELIEFGQRWDTTTPMMVHCHMGQSRSPAAAYIVLCTKNSGREQQCAEVLRKQAPHCEPNMLMVRVADEILNKQGRMVKAIQGLEKPVDQSFPGVFTVPVDLFTEA